MRTVVLADMAAQLAVVEVAARAFSCGKGPGGPAHTLPRTKFITLEKSFSAAPGTMFM